MELRIKQVDAYNGVFPITAYMVQKKNGFFGGWVDIKGFENKQKAKDLLRLLS